MSPRRNRGGRGHTRLRVRGWGSPNFDDWRKSLALCLLCGFFVCLEPRFVPNHFHICILHNAHAHLQLGFCMV